jgi:5-methylcytosine-specific restriction endonuclease McrA
MKVILLNLDYSYINSISVRRALRLIAKGKVTVEKYSEIIVRTVTKDIAVPLILRLVYLVRQIYRKAVTWSKKNVMVRDDFKCVYCGTNHNLNIDHVFPQSKGGKNTFENTVTSCLSCNNRKGDRTFKSGHLLKPKVCSKVSSSRV